MYEEDKIITAYDKSEYQNKLQDIRIRIEKKLNEFLECLGLKYKDTNLRFFNNVESRIKTSKSLKEKIYRKNYINKWNLSEDVDINQKIISTSLPDLIGFRINCFFFEDEKKIFEEIKEYFEKNEDKSIILLDNANLKQENGKEIFKITGKYICQTDDEYNFEIQIKSLMHNLWGEVEHKTIYKGLSYDPDSEKKEIIVNEIFSILNASDKQLVNLFSNNLSLESAVNLAFYHLTSRTISQKAKTEILSKHYNVFFKLFKNSDLVKEYVGLDFTNGKFEKKEVNKVDNDCLKDWIDNTFSEYDIDIQKSIASILYKIDDKYQFYDLILTNIKNSLKESKHEEITEDNYGNDLFSDEEENDTDLAIKSYLKSVGLREKEIL